MDQRASYRCSRHKKMDHDYPECVAEARAAAPVAKLEPVEAPSVISSLQVTPNPATVPEARKRGRPRVLSDEQRREKVRQRVAGWRAAKVGKVVAS